MLSPRTPLIVSSGGLFGTSGGEALRAFEELGIRQILHRPHNAMVLLQSLAEVLQGTAAADGGSEKTSGFSKIKGTDAGRTDRVRPSSFAGGDNPLGRSKIGP